MVRHCTLTATFVGSNPTPPANKIGEMGMKTQEQCTKLYKGRYLIALYDKDDRLVDVGLRPSDLELFKHRPESFYEQTCRGDVKFYNCNVYLIDCLEKHDDIFKEEDEIFLEEINAIESKDEQLEKLAKELGISKRTAYRWKALGKLKGF